MVELEIISIPNAPFTVLILQVGILPAHFSLKKVVCGGVELVVDRLFKGVKFTVIFYLFAILKKSS